MSRFESPKEAVEPAHSAHHEPRLLGGRPSFGLALLSAVLLLPALAHSSEVVDLRVGSHEEFTRVVFELETPAGYRVSR